MTIEFSFVAQPDLGTKALRFMLWRRAGPVGPLAVVLLVLLLPFLTFDDAWRPAAYVVAGAALMLFVLFLLAAAHRRRLTRRFFRKATDHTVKVLMKDDDVIVTTALGSATLPWHSFERLWKGKSVVLLFYSGWQYLAFPAESVPQEALQFATSKLASRRKDS